MVKPDINGIKKRPFDRLGCLTSKLRTEILRQRYNKPFADWKELEKRVRGVGPKKVAILKKHLCLTVQPFDREMICLTGPLLMYDLKWAVHLNIAQKRNLIKATKKSQIRDLNQLLRVDGIGLKTLQKIRNSHNPVYYVITWQVYKTD